VSACRCFSEQRDDAGKYATLGTIRGSLCRDYLRSSADVAKQDLHVQTGTRLASQQPGCDMKCEWTALKIVYETDTGLETVS
jgi:hypothetical protein